MKIRCFWWRGTPNFGDVIARDLVRALTPHDVVWAPADAAELVVTGSVATMLPDRFGGTVLGTGIARPQRVDLTAARVLALRGELTRASVQLSPENGRIVLGDPGLLAGALLEKPAQPLHEVGVVAHWQDHDLRRRWPGAMFIDVRREPSYVVRQIASCARIVASSLHGIIVADAFGLERRWETFDRVQGGGFKFRDHATVVGNFAPGEWGRADEDLVRHAQLGLLEAFGKL